LLESAPDSVTFTATTPNRAPVADAGSDGSVSTGSLVTLDGSGSSDPDGDALTFAWRFTSRPAGSLAALSDANAVAPTFTPDLDGAYVIELVVGDGLLESAPDSVTFTATTPNRAPVADAGSDGSVEVGSLVTLDGSGSSDPDGDALTFAWRFTSRPEGSLAALSDTTAPSPTFVADLVGDYVIELVVNDGSLDGPADTVTVTSTAPLPTLIGHWSFDEGSGSIAADSSATEAHGTLEGAIWTADRHGTAGKAVQFGDGAWVDVPDAPLKPAEITLAAWVYITGLDGSAAPIFSAEQGLGAAGFSYRLQIMTDGRLRMEAVGPYTTYQERAAATAVVPLNEWHHVAGTYDGYSVRAYIDGQLAAETTYGIYEALQTDPAIRVGLGHLDGWGVQWFRGSMDDMRMYAGALSAEAIAALAEW
jgi:hypothetical protein